MSYKKYSLCMFIREIIKKQSDYNQIDVTSTCSEETAVCKIYWQQLPIDVWNK